MRILPSRRTLALAAAALAGSAFALVAVAPSAQAHGSTEFPISRVYGCYKEGPENPVSAACRAAVAASGTQPFYDWNGLRIGDAAGRHRQLIPDGKLCSAGNALYRGLDLVRGDWKATPVTSGQRLTMSFYATAPHRGAFEVYLTRPSYRTNAPLRWADLTRIYRGSPLVDTTGHYTIPLTMPARKGKQVLFTIWQRSDSPEAFYACSDLRFPATAAPAPPASAQAPAGRRTADAAPAVAAAPEAPAVATSSRNVGRTSVPAAGVGDPGRTVRPVPSVSAVSVTALRVANVSAHPARRDSPRVVLFGGLTIVAGLLFGVLASILIQAKVRRPARRWG